MHNSLCRTALIALALFAYPTFAFSQARDERPGPVDIAYTGKLIGYFRDTKDQSGDPLRVVGGELERCPSSNPSVAAAKFLELRNQNGNSKAILLGTGDNFSPQLEARVFNPVPPNGGPGAGKYQGANKEFYFSDGRAWFPNDRINDASMLPLRKRFAAGLGTIATDNVGCFLAAARFVALVPGKHDFYFGAERVRMLGRFLASLHQTGYQPVQMLGANLVIKTTSSEDPPPQPDRDKSKWPDEYSVLTLREGRPVYPWFSSLVRVKVAGPKELKIKDEYATWSGGAHEKAPKSQFRAFVDAKSKDTNLSTDIRNELREFLGSIDDLNSVYLCKPNEANEIIRTQCAALNWHASVEDSVSLANDSVTYSFSFPPDPASVYGKDNHISTFQPGKNYGFCLKSPSSNDKVEKQCVLFPTYTPFLTFPNSVAASGTDFTDPDPFVVIQRERDHLPDVAIFGVVDRSIGEQVGVLNFSWLNNGNKLKTVVSAEDPAEALREQLDYFNVWYKRKWHSDFKGLKVLLAQMSPEHARVLAARMGTFQVVIAAADEEQGTSENELTTVWSPIKPAGAFVAVPLPYFDSQAVHDKREGTVHFGMIEVSANAEATQQWTLKANHRTPIDIPGPDGDASHLWDRVAEILPACLPTGFERLKSEKPQWDELKWLTLCAMRAHTGADVAMIQKRDLFQKIPADAGDAPDNVQQLLDRVIWKGDLLTLVYVPGSALKKALDQSKKYDDEDSNPLSVADERLRGLEVLGADKVGKDYVINEVPLDEKKIYAVATSDYIGAGDTGYPDFAASALRAKTRPEQFPKRLVTISSVVCRTLYKQDADARCLREIITNEYLDETSAEPAPTYVRPGFGSKLWELFPFKLSGKIESPKTTLAALKERTQQHPIWMFSLKSLSLSFDGLSNNLTDAEIVKKFGGVKTSGVTAKKAQTITTGLDLRLSRSSHTGGPFVSTTIDYKRQSTGDVAPKISQINNRVTGETGYVRNLLGGRSQKSMGLSFSLYSETQLQKPFSTFTLAGGDSLKISQNRSLMLLPRLGLFWRNGVANSFAGGLQAGRELRALVGYRFDTGTGSVECLPKVTETFADCIKALSTGATPSITKDSAGSAILHSRPRAGFYWKSAFAIPFGEKMKYEFSDTGDFFFNFSQDNATDTRYRDESKHSLKFMIWPSLSIGPSLRLLLYKNKVNRDFLFQKEFGFETTFAFDLFNRRETGVQLKHKP